MMRAHVLFALLLAAQPGAASSAFRSGAASLRRAHQRLDAAPEPKGGNSSSAAAPAISEASAKQITAVVDTLKDILASMDGEEKGEAANYKKFQEWCKSEAANLNASLAQAKDEGERSSVSGKELGAAMVHLDEEIREIAKEIGETQKVLEQAAAIRDRESEKYQDDINVNLVSTKQVDQAIKLLSTSHGVNKGQAAYALGSIKGIKEKLEKTRADIQGDEQKKQAIYADLLKAKKGQLKSLEEELAQKKLRLTESRIADVEGKRVATNSGKKSQELGKLLKETQDQCHAKEAAWKVRTEERAQEREALQEAIAFVAQAAKNQTKPVKSLLEEALPSADDDATDSQEPSFLQVAARGGRLLRRGAGKGRPALVLLQTGGEEDDQADASENRPSADDASDDGPDEQPSQLQAVPSAAAALSQVVTRHGGDPGMERAKEAVTKILAALEQQQKEEADKVGYCKKELTGKAAEEANLQGDIKEMQAGIDSRSGEIATLGEQVSELQDQVAQLKSGLEKAAALRKKEAQTYEANHKDRTLALKVLKQAIEVMKKFYATQDKTSLLEAAPPSAPAPAPKSTGSPQHMPPPPTWGVEGTRKSIRSQGAVAMIEKVFGELEKEQKDAAKAEADAAAAHEKLERDTRTESDRLMSEITDRMKNKAKLGVQLNSVKESEVNRRSDLKAVQAQAVTLHKECDEIMKFFDERTKARTFELGQLKDVMDLLSGSSVATRTGFLESGALSEREAALLRDMSRSVSAGPSGAGADASDASA